MATEVGVMLPGEAGVVAASNALVALLAFLDAERGRESLEVQSARDAIRLDILQSWLRIVGFFHPSDKPSP